MDAIITDGLYCPPSTLLVASATGGAQPPCPEPPVVVEIVPQICDIDVDCDC